jgi:hypothetical protein
MSKYKLIQVTNTNIGALDANSLLPLGLITRRYNSPSDCCSTFDLGSSSSDTLYINEPGYYKITYSLVASAAAEGVLSISMLNNQNSVYTVSSDVTAAGDVVNLTLIYVIRVCPNCCSTPSNCPVAIQFQLGDVATGITPNPSISNLIVEKVG